MGNFFKNRGFWGILLLIGMGAVLSVFMKDQVYEFSGNTHLIFSFVFSIIPGLLWLWFFYLQDKYEREPHHFLLGVFVISMLLAYSVALPLENFFRDAHEITTRSPMVEFLWSVLVFATIQEVVKFIAVRYSIYRSEEFNEPADGVIYSIAAGLGFAATYNIVYLNSLDAINFGVVPVRIIEFYLVSAVTTGIMGYFIGKAKFEKSGSELKMLVGFILAVLLNGTYNYIQANIQGFEFNIWNSLVISAVFTIVVYSIMYALLHRSVESSPFKKS